MTVEELEIIVEANIEPALKELKKLMPQINQSIGKASQNVEKAMENINFKKANQKINSTIQKVKQKIDNFFKTNNEAEVKIKINDKETLKQISQVEKQIDALQKKIEARKIRLGEVEGQADERFRQIANQNTPEGISANDPKMDAYLDRVVASDSEMKSLNKEAEKLSAEIQKYNEELNSANQKMEELKNKSAETNNNHKGMKNSIGDFKGKIESAKNSAKGIATHFKSLPKVTQNITNNIKGMTTGIKAGLGNVLKYAGALFGLRTIYNILRASAQSWLSSQNQEAQQLNANIEYMKYALGSTLAPVIKFITDLIFQLLKAIQSLVYAFSGVNIFAKATAESMKSASGSAKETSKSLSGVHSEINNVNENKSSGGGNSSPDIDLSNIDSTMNGIIDKIKSKLLTIFQPVVNSWNKYGAPLLESMQYSFTGIKDLVISVGDSFEEVWVNGTGEQTLDYIFQILISIFNIIGNIGIAFSNAWENDGNGTKIIQELWNGLNNLLNIIAGVYKTFEEWTHSDSFQVFANAIISICETLSSWFERITIKLQEIWENGGKDTFNKLLEFISKLVEAIDVVLKALSPVVDFIVNVVGEVIKGIIKSLGYVIDALSGVLDFIIGIFTGDWSRAWNGIKDIIKGIGMTIQTIIETVWNFIYSIISTIVNGIKNSISITFNAILSVIVTIVNTVKNAIVNGFTIVSNFISNILNTIGSIFSSIWDGICSVVIGTVNVIKNTISNVLNNISGIWNSVWDGMKNVVIGIWNGIWNSIKSVINAILWGIESFVNGVIRGVNFLLSGINNVANAVGSVIGLDPIYLRLSEVSLPRLAKGGVIDSPQIAMMGEYTGAKSNPEIVTPQNIMRETFEDVLSDYSFNSNDTTGFNKLIIQFSSTQIALEIEKLLQEAKRQNGTVRVMI